MLAGSSDLCEILPWDTEFFGFRIARIRGNVLTREQVERIDAWCRQSSVYCLYFLASCDDKTTTELAEDNRFRLVDIRMTLACSLPDSLGLSRPPLNDRIRLRQAHAGDADGLRCIARGSYHGTRFYYDTNFPTHLSDLLYETWIRRSCEGYADVVFVAEFDEELAGYITCHLDKEHRRGRIGLVGVGSHVQGIGIGQALVCQALDWFVTRNVAEVSVVTQGRSCTAQRLYQRSGFLTEAVQLWYHKWYRHPRMVHD